MRGIREQSQNLFFRATGFDGGDNLLGPEGFEGILQGGLTDPVVYFRRKKVEPVVVVKVNHIPLNLDFDPTTTAILQTKPGQGGTEDEAAVFRLKSVLGDEGGLHDGFYYVTHPRRSTEKVRG